MALTPIMTVDDLNDFLDRDFPQLHADGRLFLVSHVGPGTAAMRLEPIERHLRPGGTVSGPTLFALADVTSYVTILAHIGPVALAVTTNLSINFLLRPPPGPLECQGEILKLGKRLAVVETRIRPAGGGEIVAQATATFSIPPR